MSNEVLAILAAIFFMSCAVGAHKLGRNWLQAFISISYIITICIATKFFDFFGVAASAGAITYAGIFLATDIMTEKYGKQAGYQTVRISFAVGLLFVAITQLTLIFDPMDMSQGMSDAMDVVFGSTVRLLLAGYTVYLIAQHFDVWLYHKIDVWTGGKYLWLRNNGSTITSQILDSVLFFTLAFYGTMPNDVFVQVLLVGLGMKIVIALCDTPFMYLSKKITPLDEKA